MYAKVDVVRFSSWAASTISQGYKPDVKVYLKEVGAITFNETRPMFGLAMGWVEVPQGSCIKINLKRL